jgi:predicted CXXCH cytochrome family protein
MPLPATLSALLFLFALGKPQEPEHPVTLPADTESAKCVECHTDKQEGKHVHTAVSTIGCTACHQIQTEKEVTHITLVSPPTELCTTCHEASKDPVAHGPYTQKECIVCHNPHASDFPAQLRAPVNDLCLTCHLERSPTTQSVDLFGVKTLTADDLAQVPRFFVDAKRHLGHPYVNHPVAGGPDPLRKGEDFSCLTCHLPHTSAIPMLLSPPWEKAEICDQCHSAAKAMNWGRGSGPQKNAAPGPGGKPDSSAPTNGSDKAAERDKPPRP